MNVSGCWLMVSTGMVSDTLSVTSIRGFAEVLEMGAYANPNQLNQGLSSILSESERMEKLVSNLLTLNHLDQNRLNAEDVYSGFETINLSALIEEMAPQLKILALNRKIEFKIDPRIEIKGQRNGLKQVVLNLFQNAVQHTSPVEGVISIVLERLEDKVSLSISDNGKGMSPDLIPKIFDRFYRGEGHRSREEGGYGLGLAIVKSLVELHRGEVKVESNMGDGSTFTVIFSIDE